MHRRAVGLFAKPAEPGRVKTRLCPPLTPGQAAELYAAFLEDLSEVLDSDPGWDWTVFSTDPEAQERAWPTGGPAPRLFRAQRGEDLGARMHAAFAELLGDGYTSAVLIGSDHPTLTAGMLDDAFSRLERAEVVFGPSLDGGYYLVGMNTPRSGLFRGMTWSHPAVLSDTLERVRELGIRPSFLPPWYDVDTREDLAFLRLHIDALLLENPDHDPCPSTRAVLDRLPARVLPRHSRTP